MTKQNGARRVARSAVRRQAMQAPWWAWVLAALAVASAAPGLAQTGTPQAPPDQTLPEVVRPRPNSPTLPPGNDGTAMPQPRSEQPQTEGTGRAIPDSGVIAPPVSGLGTTPVIRPPSTGTMPVIPPPGAAGGEKGVIPK